MIGVSISIVGNARVMHALNWAPLHPKDAPATKMDRDGLTWPQRRGKIEEAIRIAKEQVKTGKSSPPPIRKP
jgi:hypothetical protein